MRLRRIISISRCIVSLEAVLGLEIASNVWAGQVILDGSLGPGGALAGPNFAIPDTVGKTVGKNLFHSFSRFDLSSGEIATFSGANTIHNVLSRVKSGSASSIDGTIACTIPGANFYLINPDGVLFGPNGRVNVSGSFVATSADYVKLADGAKFVARNPTATDDALLTTATPAAFGFLGPSGPIMVTGTDLPALLEVSEGKSISLIGGEVQIVNGEIKAPSGRINCVSVESEGELALDVEDILFTVDTELFPELSDFTLSDGSFLDVTGTLRGGRVTISARNLTSDFSLIFADNNGNENALGIQLTARDELKLNASSITALAIGSGNGGSIELRAASLLFDGSGVATDTTGDGTAGDITVEGNTIQTVNTAIGTTASGFGRGGTVSLSASDIVVDGGFINSTTFEGQAGDIIINAEQLLVRNFALVQSDSFGPFPGGEIIIGTDSLEVSNDGVISTSTLGIADAGSINIKSKSVRLDGDGQLDFTGLRAQTLGGGGEAGDIVLAPGTDGKLDLEILNGAQIFAGSVGSGAGGTIDIRVTSIKMDGNGTKTGILADSIVGDGKGGDIVVNGGTIDIRDGARISAATAGQGAGGEIEINANSIRLDGQGSEFFTGIAVETSALDGGDAGKITVGPGEVGRLSLEIVNGARISATTLGAGQGGPIDVTGDSILLDQAGGSFFTGIEARTFGEGNGGGIEVRMSSVEIRNGAQLSASTGPDATGDGGSIDIRAKNVSIENGSSIECAAAGSGLAGSISLRLRKSLMLSGGGFLSTSAPQTSGGDIAVFADTISLTDSSITAEAAQDGGSITLLALAAIDVINSTLFAEATADGGNITLGTPFFISLPYFRGTVDPSTISANADPLIGIGGNIQIGKHFAISPDSVITATGAQEGNVEIGVPDIDLTGSLAVLGGSFLDAETQIRPACAVRLPIGTSSFIVVGRGGLPPEPDRLSASFDW